MGKFGSVVAWHQGGDHAKFDDLTCSRLVALGDSDRRVAFRGRQVVFLQCSAFVEGTNLRSPYAVRVKDRVSKNADLWHIARVELAAGQENRTQMSAARETESAISRLGTTAAAKASIVITPLPIAGLVRSRSSRNH
jgi:hypothetical protein